MGAPTKKGCRTCDSPFFILERMKGIEPSYQAWEARILPLNYTRMKHLLSYSTSIPVFCKAPS